MRNMPSDTQLKVFRRRKHLAGNHITSSDDLASKWTASANFSKLTLTKHQIPVKMKVGEYMNIATWKVTFLKQF